MVRGKYKTEQKQVLLKYLMEHNSEYVSAEDIGTYFKEQNINIGQTTIYRLLNTLEKQEKLRIELREHTKFYQYISENCCEHYHLKCEKCGKIIHFECDEFADFNNHILKEHNFHIDCNAVICGICEACLAQESIQK